MVNRFLFNVWKGDICGKIIERERTWKRNHTKKRWDISGPIYKPIWKTSDIVCFYSDGNYKEAAGRTVQG